MLSIVGLGYGRGEQVTLRGCEILRKSSWIGHFGLTPSLNRFLIGFSRPLIDFDECLASALDSNGFTARASRLALETAFQRDMVPSQLAVTHVSLCR